MSKQPVKPASANDSAQPRAKGTPSATATAPPAQSSPPNWFSSFPPGEFQAERVSCSLGIGPDARTARLFITDPDSFAWVELKLELTDCKSLFERLREAAADCRAVNALLVFSLGPIFSLTAASTRRPRQTNQCGITLTPICAALR